MRRSIATCVLMIVSLVAVTPAAAGKTTVTADRLAAVGPYEVDTSLLNWTDAARQREVPVKIYAPKTGAGPFPVIVFSHGLGGSREGYAYLGQHWASHGYVSVHLQHVGSDDAVWRGVSSPMQSMQRAAADVGNLMNRPKDVSFAIDQLEQLNRHKGPLQGRLDLGRIGAAGHSFGAYTTLAVAGQVYVLPTGREVTMTEPRVKAAIAMSAPVAAKPGTLDRSFGSIRIPCFHMTGTKDNSPIGKTQAEDRRLPFDHTTGADKYLVIFTGGDHMIFSGRPRLLARASDKHFQELILISTTAFWDAYLRNNPESKTFLTAGPFKAALGDAGTFEQKLKP